MCSQSPIGKAQAWDVFELPIKHGLNESLVSGIRSEPLKPPFLFVRMGNAII